MIRVAIQARSPVVRAGLAALLRAEPELQVVDLGDDHADVIVAAVGSPEDGLPRESREGNRPPTVLLVPGSAPGWRGAFARGAAAVLPDDVDGGQLAAAIAAVAAGLAVVPADEVAVLAAALPGSRSPAPPPTEKLEALTGRELQVLRAMAEGTGNKQIAAQLSISEHTVKFHVASILAKLGAGSRTEAVTQGIRRGLVLI